MKMLNILQPFLPPPSQLQYVYLCMSLITTANEHLVTFYMIPRNLDHNSITSQKT